jgi:hypothetical protein
LAAKNEFKGAKAKLEHLSVAFVPFKKEADVLRTIDIMFEDIHPSSPQWPYNLQHAVEVFFVRDRRTKVRRMVWFFSERREGEEAERRERERKEGERERRERESR